MSLVNDRDEDGGGDDMACLEVAIRSCMAVLSFRTSLSQ